MALMRTRSPALLRRTCGRAPAARRQSSWRRRRCAGGAGAGGGPSARARHRDVPAGGCDGGLRALRRRGQGGQDRPHRLNELQVASRKSEGRGGDAFRTVLVTGPGQPFGEFWWPPGHIIGWEHTFIHEIHHFLTAVVENGSVAPHGATFEDGYWAAKVCDAILRSAETGAREPVMYRS